MTTAQLYKAIGDLQTHIDNRLDNLEKTVHDRCAGIDERVGGVDDRIVTHEQSDHGSSVNLKTTTGIATLVAAIVAAIAGALGDIVRH